jgi:hypothetical protein
MRSEYKELEAGVSHPPLNQEQSSRPWFYLAVFSATSCLLVGSVALVRSSTVWKSMSPPCVGCDIDSHGCIPSAGYTWCDKEAECIRPWEHGAHDEVTMAAKCGRASIASASPMDFVGGDKDRHGCIESAGFSWCELDSKCIRPWEIGLQSKAELVAHCGGAAKSRIVAVTGVGCTACTVGEMSLPCRACKNAMSVVEFCQLCSSDGLNDVGCTECPVSGDLLYTCNCPSGHWHIPWEVTYPCSAQQHRALLNGTSCPYYALHGI